MTYKTNELLRLNKIGDIEQFSFRKSLGVFENRVLFSAFFGKSDLWETFNIETYSYTNYVLNRVNSLQDGDINISAWVLLKNSNYPDQKILAVAKIASDLKFERIFKSELEILDDYFYKVKDSFLMVLENNKVPEIDFDDYFLQKHHLLNSWGIIKKDFVIDDKAIFNYRLRDDLNYFLDKLSDKCNDDFFYSDATIFRDKFSEIMEKNFLLSDDYVFHRCSENLPAFNDDYCVALLENKETSEVYEISLNENCHFHSVEEKGLQFSIKQADYKIENSKGPTF